MIPYTKGGQHMVRSIGAVVAGILVVGIVVGGLQYAGSLLYPLPEGLDPFDPADAAALGEHMSRMPVSAWMLAFGSEIVGVFLGALAAGSIARHRKAVFIGALIVVGLAGSIMNWVSFSHPMWFIIGQLIAYPLVFFGAVRLLGRSGEQPA
jgi:hypothetical protein